MAKVPTRNCELVETFDRYIEAYRSSQYNETQLRREIIDPFFEELGWDVTNKAGHAQAYKDVIHEDAIKIGSATKAPDYCFRIGGSRKFFLEAKKPSVDIKGYPPPSLPITAVRMVGEDAVLVLQACIANGCSWGFMYNKLNQYEPFEFNGYDDDRKVYDKFKEMTERQVMF